MRSCPQTVGQSVFEHGISVWKQTRRLILDGEGWVGLIKPHLYDPQLIKLYNIFHDCGKPYCLIQDEKGNHFPNHAEISYQTFLQYFDNELVANLIRDDMVLHTATAEDIANRGWTKSHAFTLLVSALGEIHSNAKLFGGTESTSFKIKHKKIEQRAKQLLKMYL
jgi:hypothetical protein